MLTAKDYLKKNKWPKRPRGKRAKFPSNKSIRYEKLSQEGKQTPQSVKEFCDEVLDAEAHDCIFVPGAAKGKPASVTRFGRQMAAARYVLTMTQGTPKIEKAVCRHLCGNGHLSCVNPKHLRWGTPGDNVSDQQHHRHVGGDVQDRINSVSRD